MSQKSSLLQVTRFVSRPLMPDKEGEIRLCGSDEANCQQAQYGGD
jgi:hypothetical protein